MKRIFYEILEHLSFALIRFMCKLTKRKGIIKPKPHDPEIADDRVADHSEKEDEYNDC